jgi:hypothetical protein
MATHITRNTMTVKTGDRVAAAARFSEHAAADGCGAWIVSAHPARLFTRDQVITALTAVELGEYPDSHPLIAALRQELQ